MAVNALLFTFSPPMKRIESGALIRCWPDFEIQERLPKSRSAIILDAVSTRRVGFSFR